MDNFQPQSGATHPHGGHEEGEVPIHGVVLFLAILVVSGIFTFIAARGLMNFFEWVASRNEKPATPVQEQLNEQRGELIGKEGVKPQPDWYKRSVDEKYIEKTFPTPRLQADDAADMNFFLQEEEEQLETTGKTKDGGIHIPVDRAIDLLSQNGLPAVNGTFTPMPSLGPLGAVADAAKRRVGESTGPAQQPKKSPARQ